MQTAFELLMACGVWSICCVYPFVLVSRGQRIDQAIAKGWALQIVYFAGICFGIPAVGTFFLHLEGGRELNHWVPEKPVVGATLICGWIAPLVSGLVARLIRSGPPSTSDPPVERKQMD